MIATSKSPADDDSAFTQFRGIWKQARGFTVPLAHYKLDEFLW